MTARPKYYYCGEERLIMNKKAARYRLREKYGDNCCHCGKQMLFKRRGDFARLGKFGATIEHLIPVRDGGSNDLDNLRLAHKICNNMRDKNEMKKIPISN